MGNSRSNAAARAGGRRLLAVLAATALLVGAPLPAAGAVIETVLATKADEWNPAASASYLAWTVWTGKEYIVYAKPIGGSRFRVSRERYSGVVGGIDGTTLIYQEWSSRRGSSDIFVFDLDAKTRTKVGDPVSTSLWEYWPSISGDWILFARWFRSGDRKLLLYNTVTEERRVIASTSGERRQLLPGQVSGDYVVYEKYAYDSDGRITSGEVFRYDIPTETTAKVPNPRSRWQYSPSVNPAGTVYYGRSGFACGRNVTIRKYPVGGPAETLASIPRGTDFYSSYAVDNGDGTTDVYFDAARCGGKGNIKKVTDA